MSDFFVWLFELLHGIQNEPLWADEVYVTAGWLMVLITIAMLIFYYHMLNRYFISWFKVSHWFLFMLINSLIIALTNILIAIRIIEPIEYDPAFLEFAMINILYAAIFYAVFSLVLCWGSPHAKYTPYKFISKSK